MAYFPFAGVHLWCALIQNWGNQSQTDLNVFLVGNLIFQAAFSLVRSDVYNARYGLLKPSVGKIINSFLLHLIFLDVENSRSLVSIEDHISSLSFISVSHNWREANDQPNPEHMHTIHLYYVLSYITNILRLCRGRFNMELCCLQSPALPQVICQ